MTSPAQGTWITSRFNIDLNRPQVMAIVNVTPDSFSDGGQHAGAIAALRHCEQVLKDGADILDIGGESTRPGSPAVPLDEELRRVLPVVREAVRFGVPISVDTYKPEVMQAVLDEGADVINDIWALRQGRALDVVAGHPRCGVCLMHMHREPRTMQAQPMAGDVLGPVTEFLNERVRALASRGVVAARITVDPGIGFGKTVEQNFSLLARQAEVAAATGCAVLAGWSRKSSLGSITGHQQPRDRVAASIAAALLAVERGAAVVRVHDVRETVDALSVLRQLQGVGPVGPA